MKRHTQVVIVGLEGKPDLNGRTAVLTSDWNGRAYSVAMEDDATTTLALPARNVLPLALHDFASLQQTITHEILHFASAHVAERVNLPEPSRMLAHQDLLRSVCWISVDSATRVLSVFEDETSSAPRSEMVAFQKGDVSRVRSLDVELEADGEKLRVTPCDKDYIRVRFAGGSGGTLIFSNREPLWHLTTAEMKQHISPIQIGCFFSNLVDLVHLENEGLGSAQHIQEYGIVAFKDAQSRRRKVVTLTVDPVAFRVVRLNASGYAKLSYHLCSSPRRSSPPPHAPALGPLLVPGAVVLYRDAVHLVVDHEGDPRTVTLRGVDGAACVSVCVAELTPDPLGTIVAAITLSEHYIHYTERYHNITEQELPDHVRQQRTLLAALVGHLFSSNANWSEWALQMRRCNIPRVNCSYIAPFTLLNAVAMNKRHRLAFSANLECLMEAVLLILTSSDATVSFEGGGQLVKVSSQSSTCRVPDFRCDPCAIQDIIFDAEAEETSSCNVSVEYWKSARDRLPDILGDVRGAPPRRTFRPAARRGAPLPPPDKEAEERALRLQHELIAQEEEGKQRGANNEPRTKKKKKPRRRPLAKTDADAASCALSFGECDTRAGHHSSAACTTGASELRERRGSEQEPPSHAARGEAEESATDGPSCAAEKHQAGDSPPNAAARVAQGPTSSASPGPDACLVAAPTASDSDFTLALSRSSRMLQQRLAAAHSRLSASEAKATLDQDTILELSARLDREKTEAAKAQAKAQAAEANALQLREQIVRLGAENARLSAAATALSQIHDKATRATEKNLRMLEQQIAFFMSKRERCVADGVVNIDYVCGSVVTKIVLEALSDVQSLRATDDAPQTAEKSLALFNEWSTKYTVNLVTRMVTRRSTSWPDPRLAPQNDEGETGTSL